MPCHDRLSRRISCGAGHSENEVPAGLSDPWPVDEFEIGCGQDSAGVVYDFVHSDGSCDETTPTGNPWNKSFLLPYRTQPVGIKLQTAFDHISSLATERPQFHGPKSQRLRWSSSLFKNMVTQLDLNQRHLAGIHCRSVRDKVLCMLEPMFPKNLSTMICVFLIRQTRQGLNLLPSKHNYRPVNVEGSEGKGNTDAVVLFRHSLNRNPVDPPPAVLQFASECDHQPAFSSLSPSPYNSDLAGLGSYLGYDGTFHTRSQASPHRSGSEPSWNFNSNSQATVTSASKKRLPPDEDGLPPNGDANSKKPKTSEQESRPGIICTEHKYATLHRQTPCCSGGPFDDMSSMRKHLNGPHNKFVKLCTNCNKNVIDENEYKLHESGRNCVPKRQCRGREQITKQWEELFMELHPNSLRIPSPWADSNSSKPNPNMPQQAVPEIVDVLPSSHGSETEESSTSSDDSQSTAPDMDSPLNSDDYDSPEKLRRLKCYDDFNTHLLQRLDSLSQRKQEELINHLWKNLDEWSLRLYNGNEGNSLMESPYDDSGFEADSYSDV